MKVLFYSFVFTFSLHLFSQNPTCDGNRYLNDIFPLDSTMGVVFGNSTTYGGSNADLLMDIYEPQGDVATNRPLILFAFGGSFISGDRSAMHALCRYFSTKGYVTASIDYRLYDGPLFPVPDSIVMTDEVIKALNDMRAAVRFFREDANTSNTYKIDTNLIFASGISAGGIVASHIGALDSNDVLENYVDSIVTANGGFQGNSSTNTNYSSSVRAVLNYSGALRTSDYLDASDADFFSVHDDGDGVVPYAGGFATVFSFPIIYMNGSFLIHQEAQNAGLTSELITIPGSNGHVSYFNDAVGTDSILTRSKDFLYNIVCAGSLSLEEENHSALNFKIYPVPSKGQIQIDVNDYLNSYSIEILDMTGRKVISKADLIGNQSMDLSLLKKGNYLVRIKSDHTEIKRIVLD